MLCFQEQQAAAKKSEDAKREAEKKRKKAELELVKQGKRPYYMKNCKLVVRKNALRVVSDSKTNGVGVTFRAVSG